MSVLNISLLGPFTATYQDHPIHHFKTIKVQALLIFLVVERNRTHRRESLMELLWPGMPLESAQVNLRQTIYRLRQTFKVLDSDGSEPFPVIFTDRQSVGINSKVDVHLDIENFQSLSDRDPAGTADLYRGDFLSDFYLVDSVPFENWAEGIRERLRRTVLNILDELTANAIEKNDYPLAQTYAWRQLEIDNCREGAYRQLMTALVGSGQRNAALSQFQICQQRLKDNLDIDPSPETQEVYTKIQADALKLTKAPPPKPKSAKVGTMPVFMLTDIESSTLLWDTHHEAMLPALLKHNSILEDQITLHGGRILELRGDGVKAVFEGGDPLRCQIDIQASLGSTDWGEIGDLKIRIGLHGVPTVRKGYDYFEKNDQYYGPVLNHTARIMDAGRGGQILVSERIRNTLTLPEGASWVDFGAHRVKSLENPIHIYGLMHPDLPDQSFPPLRTLQFQDDIPTADIQSIRHNLPSQQTPFIGRKEEIANLKVLLQNPDIRLVTIVGPGGMGKTRLALATAENLITACSEVQDECPFRDGIIFVSLVPLNDGDQILTAIANALNIPFDTSQSSDSLDRSSQSIATLKEKLVGYLATKEILIILDNFEHLLDSAKVVSDILSYGTKVKVLASSRERLRIREEQTFPIDGLKFPEWEAPKSPGEFTAIEMFIQRAQRVKPDFDLGIEDMIYLTRICRLVGGMPLGLELASSWVDILSLKDIAAEIQTSLDFLESDFRNIPDRHRSIRAVFDSSWSRLNDSEKLIFPRLSVFRSDFSREAAADVAKASLRNLAKFVDKSIIRFDQETNRYHIHELLRQYGAEQLESSPQDEHDTRHRHSSYYCNHLENSLHQMMIGNLETRSLIEHVGSLANIRGAWDWAIEHKDIENVNKAINGICLRV
jgi:predicted ATPase/DNA-binding SARP family transcriptional activator